METLMSENITDDYLEYESWRYSARAFWCLPLSSGKIAILTPRRDFFKLVDTWDEAKVHGPLAENAQKVHAPIADDRPLTKSTLNIELDLDL